MMNSVMIDCIFERISFCSKVMEIFKNFQSKVTFLKGKNFKKFKRASNLETSLVKNLV